MVKSDGVIVKLVAIFERYLTKILNGSKPRKSL